MYTMNLSDEYIARKKGLIILISGLSGSNRTILAKEIERDFKLKLINLENYCRKENVKEFEINSDIKVMDWENIDVYDWDKFNEDVNSQKKKGIIVYGDYFPTFKLNFEPNFHIHIKISKDKLIENRKEFIEKNPEKCAEMLEFVKNGKLELIINKITYPYYLEYRDKSNIGKFVNSDKNTPDEMYDQIFDYIIFSMRKFLNEYYQEHPNEKSPPSSLSNNDKEEDKKEEDKKEEDKKEEDNKKEDITSSSSSTDTSSSSVDIDDESIELGTIEDLVAEAQFVD
jgi:hypothetical protein